MLALIIHSESMTISGKVSLSHYALLSRISESERLVPTVATKVELRAGNHFLLGEVEGRCIGADCVGRFNSASREKAQQEPDWTWSTMV